MPENSSRDRAILSAFEEALEEEGFAPDGYEISGEIAQGGMAAVYLAKQIRPEREVALKMVLPKFADNAEVRERFLREGRAMAALDHPGVLPVYQVAEWDGMAFISMKLAQGGSLQERLSENLPGIRESVDWMIAAGRAIHFAHQRGVLHRDIKPGNLLFDATGSIYVSDFGVAKLDFAEDAGLTQTGTIIGTPNYLPPEVASGEAIGGSVPSDLYGLGAVLYECLTGNRPHEDSVNLAAQLRAIVDDDIVHPRKRRPELPKDLEVICMKALAKTPQERFENVADFVEDLQRWRDGRVILSRPAGAVEKMWRWTKRHPLSASLLSLLIVLSILGTALMADSYRERGKLLHESLLERARAERLVREPGFRERALGMLRDAREIDNSASLRNEAAALLAHWDIGVDDRSWTSENTTSPPSWREEDKGLRVTANQGDWFLPGGVLRCPPAWSSDGRFLALVRGESMEVVVYDYSRKLEFSRIPARDWPQRILFGEQRENLKIEYSDGTAMLANVRGKVLLDGFSKDTSLKGPVGFKIWEGQYTLPMEVTPYEGKLSADERLLATTSATGVQIWNVKHGCSVDFYEAENQRVDAPTDVWWIAPQKLLLQVPGALEVLTLDAHGRVTKIEDQQRVPGTKVKDYRSNGDWIIESRTEEDEILHLLWPDGDSEKARKLTPEEVKQLFPAESHKDGDHLVNAGDWSLSLPYGGEVHQTIFLDNGGKVIVITSDYRVCEWDLDVLGRRLRALGF